LGGGGQVGPQLLIESFIGAATSREDPEGQRSDEQRRVSSMRTDVSHIILPK